MSDSIHTTSDSPKKRKSCDNDDDDGVEPLSLLEEEDDCGNNIEEEDVEEYDNEDEDCGEGKERDSSSNNNHNHRGQMQMEIQIQPAVGRTQKKDRTNASTGITATTSSAAAVASKNNNNRRHTGKRKRQFQRCQRSWKDSFAALHQYREVWGNCRVPRNYPADPELALWVKNQRAKFRQNDLAGDRIHQLNSVGFVWNVCSVSKKAGLPSKSNNRKSKNSIGFKSNIIANDSKCTTKGQWHRERDDQLWNRQYEKLVDFYETHGHSVVPQHYRREEGETLGRWVHTQRKLYARNALRQDRLHRLHRVQFVWTGRKGRPPLSATTTTETNTSTTPLTTVERNSDPIQQQQQQRSAKSDTAAASAAKVDDNRSNDDDHEGEEDGYDNGDEEGDNDDDDDDDDDDTDLNAGQHGVNDNYISICNNGANINEELSALNASSFNQPFQLNQLLLQPQQQQQQQQQDLPSQQQQQQGMLSQLQLQQSQPQSQSQVSAPALGFNFNNLPCAAFGGLANALSNATSSTANPLGMSTTDVANMQPHQQLVTANTFLGAFASNITNTTSTSTTDNSNILGAALAATSSAPSSNPFFFNSNSNGTTVTDETRNGNADFINRNNNMNANLNPSFWMSNFSNVNSSSRNNNNSYDNFTDNENYNNSAGIMPNPLLGPLLQYYLDAQRR